VQQLRHVLGAVLPGRHVRQRHAVRHVERYVRRLRRHRASRVPLTGRPVRSGPRPSMTHNVSRPRRAPHRGRRSRAARSRGARAAEASVRLRAPRRYRPGTPVTV
jgi:hypothetical protein